LAVRCAAYMLCRFTGTWCNIWRQIMNFTVRLPVTWCC
jgi:hypothetical protein